jgi:hypothetical protein
MPAPKGNQFWKLRSKHGRDKLFKTPQLLWEAACEYFQWCEDHPIEAEDNKGTKNVNRVKFNRPFTKDGFFLYVDASDDWLRNFKAIADKDFLQVIHRIERIIYNQKFEGAVIGIYNSNIIARDLGLKERTDITSDDEKFTINWKLKK